MKLPVNEKAELLLLYPGGRLFFMTEDGHYKFWHIAKDGNGKVTCTWGKIGAAKPQKLVRDCGDAWGADQFIHTKCQEKLSKGYEELE